MHRKKLTPDMMQALKCLRANAEGAVVQTLDGWKWQDCYLDNAKPGDWSSQKWAGVLSQLQQCGVYKPYDDGDNDGIWGTVKLDING